MKLLSGSAFVREKLGFTGLGNFFSVCGTSLMLQPLRDLTGIHRFHIRVLLARRLRGPGKCCQCGYVGRYRSSYD